MDILDRRYIRRENTTKSGNPGEITAPLNGRIVQVNVKEGDVVAEGDSLLLIESMKMENKILADFKAKVKHLDVSVGQQVHSNQVLLTLTSI